MKTNNSDFNYLESCSVRELKQVLNNDPILVWLDRNAEEHQYQRDKPTPYDFGAFVGNKTKMMKEHMLQFLEETFPGEIYTFPLPSSQSSEEQVQAQILSTQKEIKMKKGIIVNPTLFDQTTRVYGTVDLIVRFSLLDQYYDLSHLKSLLPSAFPEDAYVIVLIKFWNINPKKSEIRQHYAKIEKERKKDLLPFLPLQKSLNTSFGFDTPFVFVLPREPTGVHTQSAKRVYSFFLPTPKDYENIQKTAGWIYENIPTLLKKSLGSSSSLAPNMKNKKDDGWSNAKAEIAKDLGELTLFPILTYKRRESLWNKHKITSTNQLLEYYKNNQEFPIKITEQQEKQLAYLLSSHAQPDSPYYFFDSSSFNSIPNRERWDKQAPIEFFVDFETVNNQNDDFAKFPQPGGFSMIFMIGCSEYIDGELQFSSFITDEESSSSEKKMITNFYNHIRDRTTNFTTNYRLYHWGRHEHSEMKKAIERHEESQWETLSWFDLLKSFKDSEIYIKNSLGFGLKVVGKSLHSFEKIDTSWPSESDVPGGLEAQVAAWHAYNQKKEGKIHNILDDKAMEEVLKYNRIDCDIMGEILVWMRSTLLSTSSTTKR